LDLFIEKESNEHDQDLKQFLAATISINATQKPKTKLITTTTKSETTVKLLTTTSLKITSKASNKQSKTPIKKLQVAASSRKINSQKSPDTLNSFYMNYTGTGDVRSCRFVKIDEEKPRVKEGRIPEVIQKQNFNFFIRHEYLHNMVSCF
jgi:hypothetical protein